MGASPDSSVDIDDDGDTARASGALVYVLRGVDTSQPYDANAILGVASGAVNSAEITTVTNGAWVITFGGSTALDTTVTAPTNYENQLDITGNDTTNDITMVGATRLIASAGAENPGAWTMSSAGHIHCVIAVRPTLIVIPKFLANYRRRREGDN
jgi:hypothetical protein